MDLWIYRSTIDLSIERPIDRSTYLSIHLPIYLSFFLSICLSIYLSICKLENEVILRDFLRGISLILVGWQCFWLVLQSNTWKAINDSVRWLRSPLLSCWFSRGPRTASHQWQRMRRGRRKSWPATSWMRSGTRLDTFCSDFGGCCFCLVRHKSNLGRMTVLLACIVKQHMKSHRWFREVAPITLSCLCQTVLLHLEVLAPTHFLLFLAGLGGGGKAGQAQHRLGPLCAAGPPTEGAQVGGGGCVFIL